MNTFEIFGKITWLWANSPLHKEWSLSLLSRNVLPAIEHHQYCLIMKDDFPVAFCSWANLSLENEIKYVRNVTSLNFEDWQSGERKWIIDWIAPFGDNYTLYKHMRNKFPEDVFRAIRVAPGSDSAKVINVKGGKIHAQKAKELINQYQQELVESLNSQHYKEYIQI